MKHLTTGDCAKFCQVTSSTVAKWMDSGLLKSFKMPNSRHRRTTREYLIAFMKQHEVPIPDPLANPENQ